MSGPVHSELTGGSYSEEEGGFAGASPRYEPHLDGSHRANQPPASGSEGAIAPASVQSPEQQSLRDVAPKSDAGPYDFAVTVEQEAGDALAHSFAGLARFWTDALNAWRGTAPPPAPSDQEAGRPANDPGEKKNAARSSSPTDPRKQGTKESAAGETVNERTAKSRHFLDDLVVDHMSPSELLDAEMREKAEEELAEKYREIEILRQADVPSDPAELSNLEKEREELLSSPPTVTFLLPSKEEEEAADDERFAVHFVPVAPGDETTQTSLAESFAPASTSLARPAADRDGAGVEELDHGDGGGEALEDCCKEDKHESHSEEHLPDHGTKLAAGGTEAATDTHASEFGPTYHLPPDVVQKIAELPKGPPASAVVPPESQPVSPQQAPAPGTQVTELVFRYKAPVGFTATLLILTLVVAITIAIGQFKVRGGQQEGREEGTTLLTFPEWNKSENGRAQLMIPEEETEMDILTLDTN